MSQNVRLINKSYLFQCSNSPDKCDPIEVKLGPGVYIFEVYGASGGDAGNSNDLWEGGYGGYAFGWKIIYETSTFYLYIGGRGSWVRESGSKGGWNGGGNSSTTAGSGGGATDIRTKNGFWGNEESLESRIIVAGGGGGSYWASQCRTTGGEGGGTFGTVTTELKQCDVSYEKPCYGSQDGCIEGSDNTVFPSTKGYGASETVKDYYCGGGGGYYGGGSGMRGSGGGSGYIGKMLSGKMLNGVNHGDGKVYITRIHQLSTLSSMFSIRFVLPFVMVFILQKY